MKPCQSKRSYEGKHIFCGEGEPVCALCLRTISDLQETSRLGEDRFCSGTFHHRHIFFSGECVGCGMDRKG